jgi:hypothetical protein
MDNEWHEAHRIVFSHLEKQCFLKIFKNLLYLHLYRYKNLLYLKTRRNVFK